MLVWQNYCMYALIVVYICVWMCINEDYVTIRHSLHSETRVLYMDMQLNLSSVSNAFNH